MSTPAVNIDVIDTKPVRACTTPNEKTVPIACIVVNPAFPINWEKKVRPASKPSAIVDGWRECKSWQHYGHNWLYDGGSVRIVRKRTAGDAIAEYPDGNYWGEFSPPTVGAFPNSVINRAETAALLRLKAQDLHLGQFIGEWKQTSRLIATSALRIASQVRYWRSRNGKHWADVKKWQKFGCNRENWHKIPRSWLEMQYGWRPLMSDIFGAIRHLKKEIPPFAHVKGYAEDTSSKDMKVNGIDNPFHTTCVQTTKRHHQCWVSLYFELSSPKIAEASSLGLINPLEVVWELTPYSFVVDWFLPIGNWLSAMTADAGFSFRGGSRSTKSAVTDVKFSEVKWNNTALVTRSGGIPHALGNSFAFNRVCLHSSPVPGLFLKNPLSAEHMLNAIALLALSFRR